jgi:hypothetical protein
MRTALVLGLVVMVQQYLYKVLSVMFTGNENGNMLVGLSAVTNNNFIKKNIHQQLSVLYVCVNKH